MLKPNFPPRQITRHPWNRKFPVAYFEGEGENPQLVVVGRSINIHTHLAQIQEAVGYTNMRYKEAFSGGQFGIKAVDYHRSCHRRRGITFQTSCTLCPQHGRIDAHYFETACLYNMKVKLAADASGHITAYFNDFTVDKGAYTLLGVSAMMRSIYMMQGSYNIPNIKALGQTVYTNNASGGAARGAGPPQSNFALESAVDMLAEKLGIDPLEFRRMNSLKPGQTKSTGMVVQQWPFAELCDAIKPHYERAKKEAQAFNAKGGKLKRGVGIACHSFGIGDARRCRQMAIEIDPDDGVTIYAAVADPGEGNDSMLTQIAAHQLGLPLEKIRLYTRDTDKTVGMGPAAGSRMTLMAGNALLNAIENLQNAMKEAGAKTYAELKKAGKPTRYDGFVKNRGSAGIDPKTGQGTPFVSDCHNIQMAEVEVNTETGAVRVSENDRRQWMPGQSSTRRPSKDNWKAAWTRELVMHSERNIYSARPKTMSLLNSRPFGTALKLKSLPVKLPVWMALWGPPASAR